MTQANRLGFGMRPGQDWCPTCEGPAYFIGGVCVDCLAGLMVGLMVRQPELWKACMREMRRRKPTPKGQDRWRARAQTLRERSER